MNWPTTIVLTLLHVGAVAALLLYWVATGIGISMGYHRLHTYRRAAPGASPGRAACTRR